MHDNKYLYFKNLVYNYLTIGYPRMDIFDKEILLMTIVDIFTKQFSKNLGWMIKRYMIDYNINSDDILFYNNVPSLKQISIYTIQRNKNINYNILCYNLQLQIKKPLWSILDTNTNILNFMRYLYNKDKSKLLNYLIRLYNRTSS